MFDVLVKYVIGLSVVLIMGVRHMLLHHELKLYVLRWRTSKRNLTILVFFVLK
jgi:hypothetical protein